jgi:hypothetical protein
LHLFFFRFIFNDNTKPRNYNNNIVDCIVLLLRLALIEALAMGTSVKGREGLYEIGSAAVFARSMDGGEFDNVAILGLA